MDTIISQSNEKVKMIKNLNDKKFRKEYQAFYLEGIKVVTEILESEKAMDIMFIAFSKDILLQCHGGEKLFQKLQQSKNVKVIEVDKKVFKNVTDTVNTQGVLAVLRKKLYSIEEEIKKNSNSILLLDQIQDAGNLGTIIRSADAFDTRLILCTAGTVDVYSPKVIRSTMGAILRVKVLFIEDISLAIEILKKNHYTIIGTSLQTESKLEEIDTNEKKAFVLGNEANGVSKDILATCDTLVKIPMTKTAESLNVSVAASIMLYEEYKRKN